MSCDVVPFQAHANYGTWSIDFAEFLKIIGAQNQLPLSFSSDLMRNKTL